MPHPVRRSIRIPSDLYHLTPSMSKSDGTQRHILTPKPVSQYYNFRDYYYLIFTKQISYSTFDFRHSFASFSLYELWKTCTYVQASSGSVSSDTWLSFVSFPCAPADFATGQFRKRGPVLGRLLQPGQESQIFPDAPFRPPN